MEAIAVQGFDAVRAHERRPIFATEDDRRLLAARRIEVVVPAGVDLGVTVTRATALLGVSGPAVSVARRRGRRILEARGR